MIDHIIGQTSEKIILEETIEVIIEEGNIITEINQDHHQDKDILEEEI